MPRPTQHLLPTGTHNLLAYRAARRAALRCLLIAQKAGPVPGDLKDQLIRSATGVPRNIAEGVGRTGKDRTHLFRIAYGSAHEASDTLQDLLLLGLAEADEVAAAERELDRARALTFGLIRTAQ